MGSDKRLLMKTLPDNLRGILDPVSEETVVKIWKDFEEIYNLLTINKGIEQEVVDYFTKANEWIKLFEQLGGICKSMRYGKTAVTPYMHSLVYHVPAMMRRHNGIKQFTGQGVEKNNDVARRIHLTKSNKWDAATDVLLADKRQQHLMAHERTPRCYVKHNAAYWGEEIKETRKKRKRLSLSPAIANEDDENNREQMDINIYSLSAAEIKTKLKEMGIHTRFRCIKKLQQMLLNATL